MYHEQWKEVVFFISKRVRWRSVRETDADVRLDVESKSDP
jgi:hypothetical protein